MAATPINLEDLDNLDQDSINPGQVVDPAENDKEIQDEIKSLAKHFIGLDKWVRRQEVIDARRQRFYYRNDQYIFWRSDAVGFVPANGGSAIVAGNSTVEIPRYTDVYNIYTPYGESLMATLIQNAPGVNWQPLDPSKPEDVTSAQTAEKYQQKIEKENDRKTLQAEVARFFYTDGRTILYTRRVEDGEGARELITPHGVLESKVVPITANKREDLVALFLSDEIDIYKAKDDYPDYAESITEGLASLGESSYERIARLGVLQGTKLLMQAGDAFSHMVTRHTVFLRPSTFRRARRELRDTLRELYPNGIKAIFCGETYCGSENVSMDEQVSIKFPTPGDGMSRPSLGKRLVPLQDVFNDEINLWHEAHDFCVPTLFMYSETGDIDAVREEISQPGNIVPFTALPPGANSAQQAFYAAVLEGIPATLPQFIQFVQGPLAQFISGAFPALFGGDTKDNDTAKGIAIQRDQAMGRMGIPWSALQELFAEAYYQAVRSTVEHGGDDATFTYATKDKSGNQVSETISLSDLKRGDFKCVADTDSSFPESTNQKRATFQMLMAAAERNPILAQIMQEPDNQEFGHEVLGLPELIIPGAVSRNKQLIEIDQLLKEGPVPPSDEKLDQMMTADPAFAQSMIEWQKATGVSLLINGTMPPMPVPPDQMEPSVQVDQQFDFHDYEFQTVKEWLSSEARRQEELKGNMAGIQNVRLHGMKHLSFMVAAMAAEPQPAPAGHKSGKPGPSAAAPILNQHAGAGAQQSAQPAPGGAK